MTLAKLTPLEQAAMDCSFHVNAWIKLFSKYVAGLPPDTEQHGHDQSLSATPYQADRSYATHELVAMKRDLGALMAAMRPTIASISGSWVQQKEFPISDWQHQVAVGDTELGYRDWTIRQIEKRARDLDIPNEDRHCAELQLDCIARRRVIVDFDEKTEDQAEVPHLAHFKLPSWQCLVFSPNCHNDEFVRAIIERNLDMGGIDLHIGNRQIYIEYDAERGIVVRAWSDEEIPYPEIEFALPMFKSELFDESRITDHPED